MPVVMVVILTLILIVCLYIRRGYQVRRKMETHWAKIELRCAQRYEVVQKLITECMECRSDVGSALTQALINIDQAETFELRDQAEIKLSILVNSVLNVTGWKTNPRTTLEYRHYADQILRLTLRIENLREVYNLSVRQYQDYLASWPVCWFTHQASRPQLT